MAGPVRIAILANGSQARNEFNKTASSAQSKFASMGKAAAKGAALGLAVAGAAALKFGADSVKAASDAQQSIGATETVFGKFAKTVIKTSDQAAKKYGLSANVYRENANLLGALLKNQGVQTDQLAGKTQKLVGIGADLAATFGGTTTEAVESLGSAFKGEFDPLEKYGISLKQSTVNAEAGAIAQAKYGKSLDDLSTSQQTALRQQATVALITKQSADSAGAFARESDTLAHKQQVLAAQFENVKVKVGNVLLPIVIRVVDFFSTHLGPAFEKVRAVAGQVADAFRKSAGDSDGLGGAMADLRGHFDNLKAIAEALWPVIREGAKAVFPLLIDAIRIVAKVIGLVSDAAIFMYNNAIAPSIRLATKAFSTLLEGVAKVLDLLASIPGAPKWIGDVAAKAQSAAEKLDAIGAAVRNIPTEKKVNVTVAYSYTGLRDPERGRGGGPPVVAPQTTRVGPQSVRLHITADQIDRLQRGQAYSTDIASSDAFFRGYTP